MVFCSANSRLQIKLNTYNEQEITVARERVKEFKDWLEYLVINPILIKC